MIVRQLQSTGHQRSCQLRTSTVRWIRRVASELERPFRRTCNPPRLRHRLHLTVLPLCRIQLRYHQCIRHHRTLRHCAATYAKFQPIVRINWRHTNAEPDIWECSGSTDSPYPNRVGQQDKHHTYVYICHLLIFHVLFQQLKMRTRLTSRNL